MDDKTLELLRRSAAAYALIMGEMGKCAEEIISLWAWGHGVSPIEAKDIETTVLRAFGEKNIEALISILVNIALPNKKTCTCHVCTAQKKIAADPANKHRYIAEAVLSGSKIDPGKIISALAKEMKLDDSDMKIIYQEFTSAPAPVDVIASMVKYCGNKIAVETFVKSDQCVN